jgi:hypothetical protein
VINAQVLHPREVIESTAKNGHPLPCFCPFPIILILTYNDAMSAELDLNFLPFYRIAGKDWPSLPGLMTAAPPRRCARGREGDHLFIYIALSGNTPFSSDEYTKVIGQMSGVFYSTSGSLTTGLHNTVNALNQTLLDRNLGTTGRGKYIVGRMVLGVLRGSQLILAQSGPTHLFLVGRDEVQHFHDPDLSGRGLGFTQTTPLYFSQLELYPGDQLVVCSQLPSGWESALLSERGVTSLESLSRKLQAIPNENINAIIIQVLVGKGSLNLLGAARTQTLDPIRAPTQESPASILPGSDPEVAQGLVQEMEEIRAQEQQSRQSLPPLSGPVAKAPAELSSSPAMEADNPTLPPDQLDDPPTPADRLSQIIKSAPPVDIPPFELPAEKDQAGRKDLPTPSRSDDPNPPLEMERDEEFQVSKPAVSTGQHRLGRRMLTWLQSVRNLSQSIEAGLQLFIKRMLPGLPEDRNPGMQASTMALIAVIVPLMVVVTASMIYMRYGRSAQYEENFKLAISEAVGAIGQNDPAIVRRAWESTLYYLERAESYQVTQDSNALRLQAQGSLDAMDQIIRLEFRPAIVGGLGEVIQVDRMAATDADLYLLDLTQGIVLRASISGQGYMVDANFICGQGTYASIDATSKDSFQVGKILDMVALPRVNPFGVTLLGMDASGTLVFCDPNQEPRAWKLEEPDIRWKNLAGFALGPDDYSVYVLDPAGNAIWVYLFDPQIRSFEQPDLFFSGDFVPKDLSMALDISVAGTDLYLLYADGHVTHCTPGLGDVVPIRCNDPETILDARLGHQSGPLLTDAQLAEMTFAAAPDPSLYMLAPVTAAIYRFSPRPEALHLQNQFRATVAQDKTLFTAPISAMTISPNRYIFLSVGNQVYFATDVP